MSFLLGRELIIARLLIFKCKSGLRIYESRALGLVPRPLSPEAKPMAGGGPKVSDTIIFAKGVGKHFIKKGFPNLQKMLNLLPPSARLYSKNYKTLTHG